MCRSRAPACWQPLTPKVPGRPGQRGQTHDCSCAGHRQHAPTGKAASSSRQAADRGVAPRPPEAAGKLPGRGRHAGSLSCHGVRADRSGHPQHGTKLPRSRTFWAKASMRRPWLAMSSMPCVSARRASSVMSFTSPLSSITWSAGARRSHSRTRISRATRLLVRRQGRSPAAPAAQAPAGIICPRLPEGSNVSLLASESQTPNPKP